MPATTPAGPSLTPSSRTATLRRSSSTSFGNRSPDPAGDQRRGIGQNAGGPKTAWAGQIPWLPFGREFLFVLAQTAEIVKALAALEDQGADSVPQRRQGAGIQPRQGSHAEAEGLVSAFPGPEQKLGEQIVHGEGGGVRQVAHEVDAGRTTRSTLPEIGERDDAAFQ